MIKTFVASTLFCLFIFSSIGVKSQTMAKIFEAFPVQYNDKLTAKEKKKLISDGLMNISDMQYSLNIDEKNGYLRMEQDYTEGQSGYQIFEICYWNMKDYKLVAYSKIGGSNGGYFQNDFKFFKYQNGQLTKINDALFKEYNSDFEVLMRNLVNKFAKENTPKSVKDESLRFAGLTFELPKEGKNINVKFDEDLVERFYSKYLKTSSYEYVWQNDGHFK